MQKQKQDDPDNGELEHGSTPTMPLRFSVWSLVSLGFAMTATWNGFGSAIGASLETSSSAGTIWTLVIAAIMNLVVSLGMAELASAFPGSGAQYLWSYKVASPEWAPFASYLSACISTCGWWLGLASVCNFVATMALAIVQLCVEGYTIHPWHQWFGYVAVLWLAILLNIVGIRFLPLLNRYLLYFSFSTLVITIVTLLTSAAPNYRSTTWVFTDTTNLNHSYGKGFLFILSLLNNTYGFMGTDAGAHLADEMPCPSINAPKVMVYPIIIGLVTAWPFAVVCMYTITDVQRVLNPPSGIGLIEIYYQATGSAFTTALLLAAFAVCLFGCAVANITGSSRQIWAASRDSCYPMSAWLAEIHPRYKMPVNAVYMTAIFTTVYGLLFLRSTTIFTSMVNASIVFMMTSYVIPQGIVAWRGRSRALPPTRHFQLGRWGLPINVVSCIWVCFLDIVACFPIHRPITAANMNWVSLVTLAIMAYIVLAWHFRQRHVFKGPGTGLQTMDQYSRQATGGVRRHGSVSYSRVGVAENDGKEETAKASKND